MRVDTVILSKTSDLSHYGLTCRTINSLKSSFDYEGKITVVESESSTKIKVEGFIYEGCNVVYPECTFNYNKFLNIGIKECESEWIMLCNNDLFFFKDWWTYMSEAIAANPDVKSFSPCSPTWHLHTSLSKYDIGYTVSKHICGWCIVLHRSVLDTCNLFDETFEFWYQDNDYAMTLQKNSVKHCVVRDSRVHHFVSGSHDLLKDRANDLTHKQQHKFLSKWNS